MADDLVGRTLLGKLRVVRQLGEGGAGQVFEVEHLVTRHRRALKIIRADLCHSGEAVSRLVREAAAAARIKSPLVAETYDAGRLEDGRAYILMELCAGRSLRAEMDALGHIPEERALRIARRVAAALCDVHRAGLVHRDIKPENLILGERADDEVRLLDFGLCKLLTHDPVAAETLTRAGALAGTPAYMAPEQFEAGAAVDGRADVWAVGVLLFEMLSGKRPFNGKTAAAIASEIHRSAAPVLREIEPAITGATSDLIARALERLPAERMASSDELLAALGGTAVGGRDDIVKGTILAGRFEVVRLLGRGGMGSVFEVSDGQGGPHRALKWLLASADCRADAAQRMAREARLARELDKEHVVEVIESGFDGERERPFLVMELCHGETLAQRLDRGGALGHREVIQVLGQLALALDAVHAHGIVHRDVKPGNVFIDQDSMRVRLLDFGVAKELNEASGSSTASDVILGTPLYMAPEQACSDRSVGPATDRYALGQLAFTLLVGKAYFELDARAGLLPLLGAIGRGVSEPARARATRLGGSVPDGFDGWFRRAVSSSAEARFDSALAQVDALERALPARSSNQRRLAWAGALTLAVLALVGVSVRVGASAPGAEPTALPPPRFEPDHVPQPTASQVATQRPLEEPPLRALPSAQPTAQSTATIPRTAWPGRASASAVPAASLTKRPDSLFE